MPPSAVVTVMVTVPTAPTGEVAVQLVILHKTPVAGVLPKSIVTVPAPAKLLPEIVTAVPPTVYPEVGEIPKITGAAYVKLRLFIDGVVLVFHPS